jgi:hypothetical protein
LSLNHCVLKYDSFVTDHLSARSMKKKCQNTQVHENKGIQKNVAKHLSHY